MVLVSLVSISEEQHAAILAAQCPGCRYGLPDTRECDYERWVHSLPDTDFKLVCRANDYRNARGRQQLAAESQQTPGER